MKTITIAVPLERQDATHVVIWRGKGFLFGQYNDAYAFVDFLQKHAGDEAELFPLSVPVITGD